MQVRKKLIVFLLMMVMIISSLISGYAANLINLVVKETSRSKEADRKYDITYSGTHVGSIDACSEYHTALLLFKTTEVIQYYVEKTSMTIIYYTKGKPDDRRTESYSHTGTADGNKSECYKSLESDKYMRTLDGTVSLEGIWSYQVHAHDSVDH